VRVRTIIRQSLSHLWSWNACQSPRKCCLPLWVWNALYNTHVAFHVVPFLLTSCFCSWERSNLCKTSMYIVKHVSIWNSTIWKTLSVFTAAVLIFPLEDPYTKCISADSLRVNVKEIPLTTLLRNKKQQHQPYTTDRE